MDLLVIDPTKKFLRKFLEEKKNLLQWHKSITRSEVNNGRITSNALSEIFTECKCKLDNVERHVIFVNKLSTITLLLCTSNTLRFLSDVNLKEISVKFQL